MSEAVPYRRRRLVLGLAAVAAVALVVVAALVLTGGGNDDDGKATTTTVTLPPEQAFDVIDRFHKEPCGLIAAEEVLQATGRQATVLGGGPPVLCTYQLGGKPAGDAITAQVIGPQSNAQYAALTDGGIVVAGTPPARWLSGGGNGGRLLAHKGSVTVEIGVRVADTDTATLQQIGRTLLDRALTRVPNNTTTAGAVGDDDCALVATQAIGALLDAETEALPSVNPASCSFRAATAFVYVERITGPLPDLDAIKRSTSGADGKLVEWTKTKLDLIDGGIYLADPVRAHKAGELYFRKGKVLYHVVVTGVEDPQGTSRRAAAAPAVLKLLKKWAERPIFLAA